LLPFLILGQQPLGIQIASCICIAPPAGISQKRVGVKGFRNGEPFEKG